MLRYFLFSTIMLSVLFLTGCGEDPEIQDVVISLNPDDDLQAAPGEVVEVTVSLENAEADTEVTVLSNPTGEFIGSNVVTSGQSVEFEIPADAELGEVYTLTFTVANTTVSRQLNITIGYESVAEVVLTNDNFTILLAALNEAGLTTALQGTGPFTVFAPTDQAFQNAGYSANNLPSGDALTQILSYHVISGSALQANQLTEETYETLEGSSIFISENDGLAINGNAAVTTPDIVTDNGVVHVINQVLLPGYSVRSYTAVLLGGPLNSTLGSYYNTIDNIVYMRAAAESNGDKVDFMYWYTDNSGSIIGSPDNEFAADAFPNTDFATLTNSTRFKTTAVTADEFADIVSAVDLDDSYSGDTAAGESRLIQLTVGQVFGVQLDESRGSRIGLVRVAGISGTQGSNRQITLDVKIIR